MKLKEIKDVVSIDTGAPCPIVISADGVTAASFYKQSDDFDEHSFKENALNQSAYSVLFYGCMFSRFGTPSNECISGHPYYELGLRSFSFYELVDSDLIRDLIKINAVHPRHDKKIWDRFSHYILTFHDNMFECVAQKYEIRETKSSVRQQSEDLLEELSL